MKKSSKWVLFMVAFYAMTASPAFANVEATAAKVGGMSNLSYYTIVVLLAAITMTLAAIGVAWAQCSAVKTAVEGIARNPGASGNILSTLLIGLAMMESLAIYVLVIALILLFANPFLKFLL